MAHDDHDVTDIYLFAINSGELYPRHMQMARQAAPLACWAEHVRGAVKRLYRAQVDGNAFPFTGPAVVEAAGQLRDYYAAQIADHCRLYGDRYV